MTGAHPLNWTHVLRTGRISPEQEAIVDYWDMRASSIELRSQIVAFVRDFGPKTLPWNDRAYNPVRSLFEKYTLEDFDLMVKSTSRLHSANPAAEQLVLRVPGVVLGEGRAEAHHLVNEVHSTLCPPANDKEPLFSPIYRQYRQEFEAPAFNTNSDAFMAKFTTQGVVSDGSPVGEAPFRYVDDDGDDDEDVARKYKDFAARMLAVFCENKSSDRKALDLLPICSECKAYINRHDTAWRNSPRGANDVQTQDAKLMHARAILYIHDYVQALVAQDEELKTAEKLVPAVEDSICEAALDLVLEWKRSSKLSGGME
ncbi:hypothetical protein JCM11491_006201 [Sporobolomyces phaffii]